MNENRAPFFWAIPERCQKELLRKRGSLVLAFQEIICQRVQRLGITFGEY